MSLLKVLRQGDCPCGSGAGRAACCLPWEEAYQRLLARLLAFAEAPEIRRAAEAAAGLFWGTEEPGAIRRRTGAELCFLEWFLQDYTPEGRSGTYLAAFADRVGELPWLEAQLLLGLLLAPMRVYEVAESPSERGLPLKDLLTGEERVLGPFGIGRQSIRSDLLVCRAVPFSRVARAGMGILRLPAGSREELSAYVRMAYRVSRSPRHVSLEDFLDGNPHLYHHFFLAQGGGTGAEAWQTVRGLRYAPGRLVYRVEDAARLRAALRRQSAILPEAPRERGEGYRWTDPQWGIVRARLVLAASEMTVWTETREDLAAAAEFVGRILQGLVRAVACEPGTVAPPPTWPGAPGAERGGRSFLRRALAAWPDVPLPALGERSPRQAAPLPALRRSVASLLGGLERDLARQKRLGRAWVDVSDLWGSLGIVELAPAQAGAREGRGKVPRTERRGGMRRTAGTVRQAKRNHHR
ncbi:MAG: hypothetical protein HY712_03490 [candidate division NC10 bacterium]|nr:hypothetical protein [candidate division NC10 bacterium]